MPTWTKVLSDAKKFGVALLGFAVSLVVAGVVPAPYDKWGPVVIALATALGVYNAKNEPVG